MIYEVRIINKKLNEGDKYMNVKYKEIYYYKNKCKVCSKEISIDDIIIRRSLFCHECYNRISQVSIKDIEYIYYKEKLKSWLLSKYNLSNMR